MKKAIERKTYSDTGACFRVRKDYENCAFLMDIRGLIPIGAIPDDVPT